MNFELNKSIELLERTPKAFRSLFYGIQYDWAVINEGPETWNAHDILRHLIHGEKTDWIPRMEIIMQPGGDKTFVPFENFPPNDPQIANSIESLIEEFERLREKNIDKLKSFHLTSTDLSKVGIHPELGEVTLQELIATWTAHDFVHLNQITRVIVKHYKVDVGPWKKYIRILNEI